MDFSNNFNYSDTGQSSLLFNRASSNNSNSSPNSLHNKSLFNLLSYAQQQQQQQQRNEDLDLNFTNLSLLNRTPTPTNLPPQIIINSEIDPRSRDPERLQALMNVLQQLENTQLLNQPISTHIFLSQAGLLYKQFYSHLFIKGLLKELVEYANQSGLIKIIPTAGGLQSVQITPKGRSLNIPVQTAQSINSNLNSMNMLNTPYFLNSPNQPSPSPVDPNYEDNEFNRLKNLLARSNSPSALLAHTLPILPTESAASPTLSAISAASSTATSFSSSSLEEKFFKGEKQRHLRYMMNFRVHPCQANLTKSCPADIKKNAGNASSGSSSSDCFDYHNPKMRRRVPRPVAYSNGIFWNYNACRCQAIEKEVKCEKGDACRYAHNKEEIAYHPSRFKTQLCSYVARADGVCSRFGIHCFTPDHQIIVQGRGWVFFNELKPGDLVATYNSESCALEYEAPRVQQDGEILLKKTVNEELIDVSAESSHVAMLTTAGHDWFVMQGRKAPGVPGATDSTQSITWSASFAKEKAGDLPSSESDRYMAVLASAENGISCSTCNLPFAAQLGLDSEAKVNAFLELYGYWLGDGSLACSTANSAASNCVVFGTKGDEKNKGFIQALLNNLGMTQGLANDYLYYNGLDCQSPLNEISAAGLKSKDEKLEYFSIFNSAWFNFFNDEYGVKSLQPPACADSLKWLMQWAFDSLGRDQIRSVLRGLQQAQGKKTQDVNSDAVFRISGWLFRDQILVAMLHAGYHAHFELDAASGVPTGTDKSSKGIVAKHDCWQIFYGKGLERFALKRSSDVTKLLYQGEVYCVTVPNGLIFARRARVDERGAIIFASKAIVIGNCAFSHGEDDLRKPIVLKQGQPHKLLDETGSIASTAVSSEQSTPRDSRRPSIASDENYDDTPSNRDKLPGPLNRDDYICPPDQLLSDRQFYLYSYKCYPCNNTTPDCARGVCPNYHYDNKRRRNPSLFPYAHESCPNVKSADSGQWKRPSSCPLGDACLLSHTLLESMYHPAVYKSVMCSNFNEQDPATWLKCSWGRACAHSHSKHELDFNENCIKNGEPSAPSIAATTNTNTPSITASIPTLSSVWSSAGSNRGSTSSSQPQPSPTNSTTSNNSNVPTPPRLALQQPMRGRSSSPTASSPVLSANAAPLGPSGLRAEEDKTAYYNEDKVISASPFKSNIWSNSNANSPAMSGGLLQRSAPIGLSADAAPFDMPQQSNNARSQSTQSAASTASHHPTQFHPVAISQQQLVEWGREKADMSKKMANQHTEVQQLRQYLKDEVQQEQEVKKENSTLKRKVQSLEQDNQKFQQLLSQLQQSGGGGGMFASDQVGVMESLQSQINQLRWELSSAQDDKRRFEQEVRRFNRIQEERDLLGRENLRLEQELLNVQSELHRFKVQQGISANESNNHELDEELAAEINDARWNKMHTPTPSNNEQSSSNNHREDSSNNESKTNPLSPATSNSHSKSILHSIASDNKYSDVLTEAKSR
jgi:hypothetical protein